MEAGFSLRAQGLSADSSVADLEVEIRKGSYRGLSLEGGNLTATWRGGKGTFELHQPVGAGRVATGGEIGWGEDPAARGEALHILTYSLPDLELRELDLSRLLGDTLPSRVNARASLTGAGTDPQTLRATAQVRLGASEFRGLSIDSALARPELESGALSAFVEGWLSGVSRDEGLREGEIEVSGEAAERERNTPGQGSGGRIQATLHGMPFEPDPLLTLDSLVFSGIDLASFGGVPSSLNGAVQARLEGLDPRAARISGEVALYPSRIRETSVDAGEGAFSLSEGDLQLSAQLSSPDGTFDLTASAEPFKEPAGFRLEAGEIRGLNLGPFLGREDLQSDLNLDLSLSGSGSSLQALEASGKVVVLTSTLNQGEIRGGSIDLDATGDHGTAQAQILTGEGEVTLQARASFQAGLEEIRVEGGLDLPDLSAFLDRGETEVEARGTMAVTWGTGTGLSFVSDLRGRIGEASIDTVDIQGGLQESMLRLDTLRVRSDLLEADGAGRLALGEASEGGDESDLTVTTDLLDLSALGPFLDLGEIEAESGGGSLHVTGPPGTMAISASLDLGPWRLKRFSGDSARMTMDYRSDSVALTTWIQVPGGRGSVDAALWADPRPEGRLGTLHQLEVSTPETLWNLEAPVPFSWKDGPRMEGFVLSSGSSRISIDGGIDPHGTQDLTLTVEQASISGLANMLGREDLTLLADGEVALSGPAASPVVEGDLRMELATGGDVSTTVDADFSLSAGALNLGAQVTDSAGGVLTLHGTLPLAFSLAPEEGPSPPDADNPGGATPGREGVNLALQTEAFDIAWIRGVLPQGTIGALGGILSADLRATGPVDQPIFEGRIGLEEGMVRLPPSAARYQDVSLSAEVRNQEIRITRASATSGSGTLQIEGSLGFQGFKPEELDLTARMDRFLAWNAPRVSATLTGSLSLSGSVQEPRVEGNLNLEGSKIGMDDVSAGSELRAVELTEEDYQMLEDYFGYKADRAGVEPSRLTERFGLDLALHFDRDVWINRSRQPRVSLEVRGDLEVRKEPLGGIRVVGTVETIPSRSYFRQFGRRFAVREGELNLTGDPSEFSFRMDAEWEVPSHSNPDEAEVVVNLEVVGNAESLELTLSSEPTMDEADIVSYLATGKPQGALATSETDVGGLGTSMAMGAMANVLEGLASDAVELDVVEIKVDPVKGTTLIAGRYVSPNLYLGFRQPVTFSESNKKSQTESQLSEVELEYRWFQWLTMNLQGGASELRLFLRARYAY